MTKRHTHTVGMLATRRSRIPRWLSNWCTVNGYVIDGTWGTNFHIGKMSNKDHEHHVDQDTREIDTYGVALRDTFSVNKGVSRERFMQDYGNSEVRSE